MNVRHASARVALTLALCVAPWLTAWWSLYRQHSAPLAFVLYHAVCFAGGFLLRSPGLPDPEAKLWSLRWQHLLGVMQRDKKARGGMLRLIVLERPGKPTRLEGPTTEQLRTAYAAVWRTGESECATGDPRTAALSTCPCWRSTTR